MHETYRMLGREHEADLAREARNRQLAAEARGPKAPSGTRLRLPALSPLRVPAFLLRARRAER
jgi:hypothetical protein